MAEPIVFNDDGTVAIDFGDTSTILGCPKLGQYRLFRRDIDKRLADLLERRTNVLTQKASLDEQQAFVDAQDVMVTGWLETVITELTDSDIPEVDEWPAWLANPKLPTKFLNHWQTAPFNSGT